MQITCKLEGGGGQKSGHFVNVTYERPLIKHVLIAKLVICSLKYSI